jgi:hypothetical protein
LRGSRLRLGSGGDRRDEVRQEVADLAVFGFDLGIEFAAGEDREAFAARENGHDARGHPGFVENLGGVGMIGAVNIAQIIGP